MDIYRIKALLKILDSGALSNHQILATVNELTEKCIVVAKGAEKRGRKEESVYFFELIKRFQDGNLSSHCTS
jgi:hypothetical protein